MLAAISRSREGSLVSQPITTRPADGSLFVKASFLAVIPNDGSPEAAYATYEVVSEEGDQRWATVCRWSDLRRLHDELDSRCAAQMKVARSAGLPSFWHHTLRLGKARISPEFCAGRAREMTKLLQTLATGGAAPGTGSDPKSLPQSPPTLPTVRSIKSMIANELLNPINLL